MIWLIRSLDCAFGAVAVVIDDPHSFPLHAWQKLVCEKYWERIKGAGRKGLFLNLFHNFEISCFSKKRGSFEPKVYSYYEVGAVITCRSICPIIKPRRFEA